MLTKKFILSAAMLGMSVSLAVIITGCGGGVVVVPPTVTSTNPVNAATGVPVTQKISATFSDVMNPLTLTPATFIVRQGITPVLGTVTYAGVVATFTPAAPLPANSTFTVTITTAVQDTIGNALAANVGWIFSTSSTSTLPKVTSINPTNAATGVLRNQIITATFSKSMDSTTINATTFTLMNGVTPVLGTVTYNGLVAAFTPTVVLDPNTVYTATITTGVQDTQGFALAANFVWSFTTGTGPELTPAVTFTTPANGATGVPLNMKFAATFDKAMDPTTLTTATFTLQQGALVVPGTVVYTGLEATFAPTVNLTPNTTYTATITTGAKSTSGNPLAADYVWSFTTGAANDVTRPIVSFTNPADTAIDVPVNQKIVAVFSKPMDSATINTTTFTLTDGVNPIAGTVSLVGQEAIFTPDVNLDSDVAFTATITTGAADLAGNTLAVNFVWNFTSGLVTDTTVPNVTLLNPADRETNVVLNKTINATFDKAMDPTTINTSSFLVTGPGLTVVPGTVIYDPVNNIATFTPIANLSINTTYTATITTAVTDLAGNTLLFNRVWTFTTGILFAQTPLQLGAASSFAVLATTSTTNAGVSQVNGDVGLAPGAVQGIPAGQISGGIYVNDAVVAQAQIDLLAAYNDAISRTVGSLPLPGALDGLTLTPGLYTTAGAVTITTGNVTLDALGDTSAIFILRIGTTLTTGNIQVVLANGTKAANVFWIVGGAVSLDTTTIFAGNILAAGDITWNGGPTTMEGRLLAGAAGGPASVNLNATTITVPSP
jgi:hypothetical protein